MTRAGVLAAAAFVVAALAPPAEASFGAPAQLTAGSYGIGDGAETVFYVEPTEMAPPAPQFVLKAADGA